MGKVPPNKAASSASSTLKALNPRKVKKNAARSSKKEAMWRKVYLQEWDDIRMGKMDFQKAKSIVSSRTWNLNSEDNQAPYIELEKFYQRCIDGGRMKSTSSLSEKAKALHDRIKENQKEDEIIDILWTVENWVNKHPDCKKWAEQQWEKKFPGQPMVAMARMTGRGISATTDGRTAVGAEERARLEEDFDRLCYKEYLKWKAVEEATGGESNHASQSEDDGTILGVTNPRHPSDPAVRSEDTADEVAASPRKETSMETLMESRNFASELSTTYEPPRDGAFELHSADETQDQCTSSDLSQDEQNEVEMQDPSLSSNHQNASSVEIVKNTPQAPENDIQVKSVHFSVSQVIGPAPSSSMDHRNAGPQATKSCLPANRDPPGTDLSECDEQISSNKTARADATVSRASYTDLVRQLEAEKARSLALETELNTERNKWTGTTSSHSMEDSYRDVGRDLRTYNPPLAAGVHMACLSHHGFRL